MKFLEELKKIYKETCYESNLLQKLSPLAGDFFFLFRILILFSRTLTRILVMSATPLLPSIFIFSNSTRRFVIRHQLWMMNRTKKSNI